MFCKPVENGVITQTFDQHKANGQHGSYGTDIGVNLGTPDPIQVKFIYDCSVYSSGLSDTFGNRVWTLVLEGEHKDRYIVYPHMDSIDSGIHVGKIYKAGTVVGNMGNTGLISHDGKIVNNNDKHIPLPQGRHCHIECRLNPSYGNTSIKLIELEKAYL